MTNQKWPIKNDQLQWANDILKQSWLRFRIFICLFDLIDLISSVNQPYSVIKWISPSPLVINWSVI